MNHLRSLVLYAFIIHLVFTVNNHAQDTNVIKYLPLKVGNVWTYRYEGNFYYNGSGYDKYTVTGSTISNGHIYYDIVLTRRITSGTYTCNSRLFYYTTSLRVDSINGNVYRNFENPCLVDSLNSRFRDSSIVCNSSSGTRCVCDDTSNINLFNSVRKTKRFYISVFEGYNYQRYIKDIGLYQYQYGMLMSSCSFLLMGCVINGIIYGDTSLTGLNKISNEIPVSFSLSQNYPNPFNPVTKIRFSIPGIGAQYIEPVQLKVYDALGREVQTLVNEQLQPGTYEVDWDASNFSSGVYYYTFSAGDYFETKKMVLLR